MEIKLSNDTKTIEPTTTEPSKPYLAQKMSNGTDYYPLVIYSSGEGVKIKGNGTDYVIQEKIEALKFSSDSNFTLSAPKKWDGTLEYTLDNGGTWTTWDGSQLSGTATQPIYIRGTGNTVITNNSSWTFTGKYCTGNIENLLDYNTVKNGGHPTMASSCYFNMFWNCTSLTTAPSLPATTLADYCYYYMFWNCTSLTTAPSLPATTLAKSCYHGMFYGCTSLKLSTTQTGIYKNTYRIPTIGTGTTAENALYNMFYGTGGTFTGTPTINTTYYVENEPV